MSQTPPYFEFNHPRLSGIEISYCYLCSRKLGADTKPDHIIPNSLFAKGAPHRPKIPVHHSCNNKKSKDDRFFVKQIQLMCSLNPKAGEAFMKFLDKAMVEKPKAFIVGRSKEIPNYKLAKDLLENDIWGWKVQHGEDTLHAIRIKRENQERRNRYVIQMAKGLYARNVDNSRPKPPQLTWIEYRNPIPKQDIKSFVESVQKLVNLSGDNRFVQDWEGELMYVGSPIIEDRNKGFLYIEFYNTIGVLAYFGPKRFKPKR